jgi:hypothetical protein
MGGSNRRTSGYANPAYAQSLSEFGAPVLLPRSGGSVLRRPLADGDGHDAMGPYPLFACPDWSGLGADLDTLAGELVSLTLVADPFADATPEQLAACFPDLMVAFKEHFVVDLRAPDPDAHHRRNARRALRDLDVEEVAEPAALLDDWVALYVELVRRHGIRGIAAFSHDAFAAQLRVPGIRALRAVHEGETVGAVLFYADEELAYYHLGAYSERGYDLRASFAIFATALERFAADGLRSLSLGAGAGASADTDDGLTRFKRGWASGTRTAYLCGRILDAERYAALATGSSYFPAYREGEFA